MHAAVVRSFDRPPAYEVVEPPVARDGEHELVVDVLASGLHPRVRSSANGSHYTSDATLPLIPGIDGVGRAPDGTLLYFVLPDTPHGAMAEQTVIDRRRSVPLATGSDAATLAAGMNPAMSSWLALRLRVPLQPGQHVLVLGATGNAGRLAVQVARHLGAGRVTAAGRDAARLEEVGADAGVRFGAWDERVADVDVVLDYVWGAPAAEAMRALVTGRRDRARALDWVQIGAVAGAELSLPSAALRAANLRLLGSGQGSIGAAAIVAELPALAAELSAGTFAVHADPRPLSTVEAAWTAPSSPGRRVVLTP